MQVIRQWIICRVPLNRIFHVTRSFGSNRVHAASSLVPKISTIALQRNECRRCIGSGFDRAPEYQKLQRQLFLSIDDYRRTQ